MSTTQGAFQCLSKSKRTSAQQTTSCFPNKGRGALAATLPANIRELAGVGLYAIFAWDNETRRLRVLNANKSEGFKTRQLQPKTDRWTLKTFVEPEILDQIFENGNVKRYFENWDVIEGGVELALD